MKISLQVYLEMLIWIAAKNTKCLESLSHKFDMGRLCKKKRIKAINFFVDCSVATEDKYGSNVNMEPDSPTDEEKQSKPDEGISDFTMVCLNYKTILTYFITLSYKIST